MDSESIIKAIANLHQHQQATATATATPPPAALTSALSPHTNDSLQSQVHDNAVDQETPHHIDLLQFDLEQHSEPVLDNVEAESVALIVDGDEPDQSLTEPQAGPSTSHYTTATIVSSGPTRQRRHAKRPQTVLATTDDDISLWDVERLRAEVIRLRREVQELRQLQALTVAAVAAETMVAQTQADSFDTADDEIPEVEASGKSAEAEESELVEPELPTDHDLKSLSTKQPGRKGKRKRGVDVSHVDENTQDGAERKASRRDEGTGKRVEIKRKPELARAVRSKIRYSMGIEDNDPIPAPSPFPPPDRGGFWVPNWHKGLNDVTNMTWLDRVCGELIDEATSGQAWRKVPEGDLDADIVKTASITAFHNMAKKYKNESRPDSELRKERWAKIRRRWGRKDLKQKRRARAALEPEFGQQLPPAALHLDYMSSEYSSQGDDTDDDTADAMEPVLSRDQRRALRHLKWDSMSLRDESANPGKGGWAEGMTEKMLEVRTPTWRSEKLNEVYRRLDQISAEQVARRSGRAASLDAAADIVAVSGLALSGPEVGSSLAVGTGHDTAVGNGDGVDDANIATVVKTTKAGHVAPSHKRFTMPRGLMRSGRHPRETGDEWMWASGEPGNWPRREEKKITAEEEEAVVEDGGMVLDMNNVDVAEMIDPSHLADVYGSWPDGRVGEGEAGGDDGVDVSQSTLTF